MRTGPLRRLPCLVLWALLFPGCSRPTKFCETAADCPEGLVCLAASRTCGPGSGKTYALSVKLAEGGKAASAPVGKVTSVPAGIECPGTCTASFPEGSAVALRVTPGIGYRFGGWSGPCEGLSPACAVSGAGEVGAGFVRKVCNREGWCWENPLPQGDPLTEVWAVPPPAQGVWAAGPGGIILHQLQLEAGMGSV